MLTTRPPPFQCTTHKMAITPPRPALRRSVWVVWLATTPNSVILRTACALHSTLAVDEAGVVLATRSTALTTESPSAEWWNSPLRLKPRMASARSAYVTTRSALLQSHWWSGFAIDAGAADLHRSSSIARSTEHVAVPVDLAPLTFGL